MKVVLITGGARGIGAATVKKFAKEKYTVILNYNRSKDQAEQLRSQLVAEGVDVHLYQADVSSAAQVAQMFAYVEKWFKHLDILVNNAGIACNALCQDITETQYDAVMDINAKGTFLCCQQAVKLFLKQHSGAIVNVASVWGIKGASCESVYSMSKHAVVGLSRSLANELAPSNVKVRCVCPPIVLTDMSKNLSDDDIRNFCKENKTSVYTAEQVAEDIFDLAVGKRKTAILLER